MNHICHTMHVAMNDSGQIVCNTDDKPVLRRGSEFKDKSVLREKQRSLSCPAESHLKTGFFIAAVYQYRGITAERGKWKCRKNERRRHSGRIIALARELFSLLIQTFRTEVLRMTKGCYCRKRGIGSAGIQDSNGKRIVC